MRKSIGLAVVAALCFQIFTPTFVNADATKVVTLGADLTEEQKTRMLNYFKVAENEAEILKITNQDERDHLSAFVPIEQIGTRTFSCAYVKPTRSGGIQVHTANLSWVTSNMIATTLSTSGVQNCQVIAASPFEVSGTGALTGVIMAYESASGETLDEEKKEAATQELVVTGNLADEVGQNAAISIINTAKMQIIEGNVQNVEQITNIVNNVIQQNQYVVDDEKFNEIIALLQEISRLNYNYEDVKDTLERVESNVNPEYAVEKAEEEPEVPTEDPIETDENTEENLNVENQDNILAGLDESILGDEVISDSTEIPTWEEDIPDITEDMSDEIDGLSQAIEEIPDEVEEIPDELGEIPDELGEIPDELGEIPDELENIPDEIEEIPSEMEEVSDENMPLSDASETFTLEMLEEGLSETEKQQMDMTDAFCDYVFSAKEEAAHILIENDYTVQNDYNDEYLLDEENASISKEEILKTYKVILENADQTERQDDESYEEGILQDLRTKLNAIFGVENVEDTADNLENQEERKTLAWTNMLTEEEKINCADLFYAFFEELYRETQN